MQSKKITMLNFFFSYKLKKEKQLNNKKLHPNISNTFTGKKALQAEKSFR